MIQPESETPAWEVAAVATHAAAPPPQLNAKEIDVALAALIDLRPLVHSCTTGTYDTVQSRRKSGLEHAERALLAVRGRLGATRPRESMTPATLAMSACVKASAILRALNAGGGSYTLNQPLDEYDIGRALAFSSRENPAPSPRAPEIKEGGESESRQVQGVGQGRDAAGMRAGARIGKTTEVS